MNGDRVFFDTNVLVYAFTKTGDRAELADSILAEGGIISVQTLNEFVAVVIHKLRMSWEQLAASLAALRVLFPEPRPLSMETHTAALRIAERYRYHVYDSLMIAAALQARCTILYSEDMRDGQVIDGLTIRNPFAHLETGQKPS